MPYHIAPEAVINATLYTLLVFSLITWTLIFFKIWQFAKNNYYNKQYDSAFWDTTDLKAAEQLPAETARGPKARVAACGFAWLAEMTHPETCTSLKFRGSPQDLLEQTLRKQTQDEQRRMEGGLTMLASIGSTAPFVGLFGTVLGIMHAMHDISASGSASLDVVAGPIGDALIATAIGIAVAVPAVLAYNFFQRRAKHHRASLENFVDGFLHIAFGDSYNNTSKNKD
ncbi:MotA/TolQ/ExbB proton channel family protein [Methylomonas albis]|uniref:MotA/TolQ/ExbB proton channel family protein n=1 Tax=Methylomonas albis TaxID=1854563 RepID=A0ABR9D6D8_9GAMM|nr:MotA/TolQ/ExbB proton channel family protein [Methylomonas albis]MBD9358662.1 MotA/TolQ/ExbB proton channel family protein [Methylomonas albis]